MVDRLQVAPEGHLGGVVDGETRKSIFRYIPPFHKEHIEDFPHVSKAIMPLAPHKFDAADTRTIKTPPHGFCTQHPRPSPTPAVHAAQVVQNHPAANRPQISPPIISAALATVAAWYASTSSDPEHANLTVRVSPRARELTASYLVDEQPMTMRVALPPAYPLRPAAVDGLARVAVPDAKWQAWLRNAQAVIAFSDGSLVDGLTAWRRNVAGALRGQTECAICYSIVGADKSLPSKRCSTCKNSFHGGCLFRWFKTSNGSSCPLCRNPFNYG